MVIAIARRRGRRAKFTGQKPTWGLSSSRFPVKKRAKDGAVEPRRAHMSTQSTHDAEVRAHRRAAFLGAMSASSASAVALLPAAPVFVRNNDVEHEYRQDSDFFYLNGLDEPRSLLVLDGPRRTMTLAVRPRDPEREVWDGPRAGGDGAKQHFGADEAITAPE